MNTYLKAFVLIASTLLARASHLVYMPMISEEDSIVTSYNLKIEEGII